MNQDESTTKSLSQPAITKSAEEIGLELYIMSNGEADPMECIKKGHRFLRVANDKKFQEAMQTTLSQLVSKLDLSTRTSNVLAAAEIRYLSDLYGYSDGELLTLRGMGEASLSELRGKMKEHGLWTEQ